MRKNTLPYQTRDVKECENIKCLKIIDFDKNVCPFCGHTQTEYQKKSDYADFPYEKVLGINYSNERLAI